VLGPACSLPVSSFRYHQPHDISTRDVRSSMACMQAAQGSREQEGPCQAAHLGAPGAGWVQRGLCSHSHHASRLCQDHHSVWQQPAGATGAQGCCAAAWPCRSLQRNGELTPLRMHIMVVLPLHCLGTCKVLDLFRASGLMFEGVQDAVVELGCQCRL